MNYCQSYQCNCWQIDFKALASKALQVKHSSAPLILLFEVN